MGYGAPHLGIMVPVFGQWYSDSDDDRDDFGYHNHFSDSGDSRGDIEDESDVSDWGDSDDTEQPSAPLTDLSVVLTLPLDVIYEVCAFSARGLSG